MRISEVRSTACCHLPQTRNNPLRVEREHALFKARSPVFSGGSCFAALEKFANLIGVCIPDSVRFANLYNCCTTAFYVERGRWKREIRM